MLFFLIGVDALEFLDFTGDTDELLFIFYWLLLLGVTGEFLLFTDLPLLIEFLDTDETFLSDLTAETLIDFDYFGDDPVFCFFYAGWLTSSDLEEARGGGLRLLSPTLGEWTDFVGDLDELIFELGLLTA